MGLVSIIVTTYNREIYLEKCLKSILSQSFKDFSVIVVSDGYFQNTELLIESLNDNRVKLISNIPSCINSQTIDNYIRRNDVILSNSYSPR